MKHRYIAFLSFIVVIMFIIMAFSGITSQQNSQNNNISTSVIKPLSYGLTVDKWSVSGKTCAPSKASMGSTVTLKIDVTSFSESKCAGPTIMYFYVNYKNVHTVDVSSTGIYTYNWNVGLNYGNINFHAEYLSESAWEDYPAHLGFKPMVFFRNAYSTFGDSTIHVKKYLDYIGYDGNNTIYFTAIGQQFYDVYGHMMIYNNTDTSNAAKGADGLCMYNSRLRGIISYNVFDSGGTMYFKFNIAAAGAGEQKDFCGATSGPAEQMLSIQTSKSLNGEGILVNSNYNIGTNVTGTPSDKGMKEYKEFEDGWNITCDALSTLPGLGDAIDAKNGVNSAIDLIHCVSSETVKNNETENTKACELFYISNSDYKTRDTYHTPYNVWSSGTKAFLCLPNSDADNNNAFKIKFHLQDDYLYCNGHEDLINDTSLTYSINVVPASAIYGSVGKTPGCCVDVNGERHDYDPNLNSSLYIENANTHTFYNATIKDGRFLFFAQPNTTYKLYYLADNGTLEEFQSISGKSISSIETGSPGTSTPTGSLDE